MINSNVIRLLLMLGLGLTVLFCCGFTDVDAARKCREASDLISRSQAGHRTAISLDTEQAVTSLCPGGAAEEFVLGSKFEAEGRVETALKHYAKSAASDYAVAAASGRIGLLQLQRGETNVALLNLNAALEKGGSDPEYHRALAVIYSRTNAYSAATYHYEKAVRGGVQVDAATRIAVAEAYRKLNRLTDAEDIYKKELETAPGSLPLKKQLARTLVSLKRYKEAIPLLTEVLSASRDDREARILIADAYAATGNTAASQQERNRAGADPELVASLIADGDRSFLKRDYSTAISSYTKAVKARPSSDSFQKLGDAYLAAGNDDEALAAYGSSLHLFNDDAGVHYSTGLIYERKGSLDKAVEEYRKVIELDQTNTDARRRLAEIYLMKGNTLQAIAEYLELLKLAPDNPVIHYKLARAYQKVPRYNDAEQEFATAIKLDPANFEPRREYISLEVKRNKYVEAEQLCRGILAIDRDDKQERHRLISLLGKQKKFGELADYLTEETRRYPEESVHYYRLGIVKEYLKDYNAAINAFSKAIDLHPTSQSYHALARTYLRLSNTKKAREALSEANRLDPARQDTRELLQLVDAEYGSHHPSGGKKKRKAKKTTKNKATHAKKKQSSQRHRK